MKKEIIAIARNLRKSQTQAENVLWEKLRNRGFLNKKFVRQHPIKYKIEGKEAFFIADFYCHEIKLIIELDGKIHLKQKAYDQFRDSIIQNLGFRVVRVPNKMIMNEIEFFLSAILTPVFK